MSLKRNPLLVELLAETRDDDTRINLVEFFSHRSPPANSADLPVIPMKFDKDNIFEFILRALSNQLQNGVRFYVLKYLAKFDDRISSHGGDTPLVYKLTLQLLVHHSKIASSEFYNVQKQLEPDISKLCDDMLHPSDALLKFSTLEPSMVAKLKNFLNRPAIQAMMYDELLRFDFVNLSVDSIRQLINNMVIYDGSGRLWDVYGWTVMDGIVLMRGYLPIPEGNCLANLYCLVLHESTHYLARCVSGNFGFSSPGKNNLFKDPDENLARQGVGLELGRSIEVSLLGCQVDWEETACAVAKEFVDEVENDRHEGPYLCKRRDQLVPIEHPAPSSGMYINPRRRPRWGIWF